MNSIFRRQKVLKTTTAMFVVTLLSFASYPEIAAAQASRAVTLLGKFATAVASGLATNLIWRGIAEGKPEPEPESKPLPKKPSPPPKAPPEPQISGYGFSLSWEVPEQGVYSGILEMRGMFGLFRVTTPDGSIVEQDMEAKRESRRQIFLIGSNPRYVPGTRPSAKLPYSPDSFSLIQLASGDWTITVTCDINQCAQVRVKEAYTF